MAFIDKALPVAERQEAELQLCDNLMQLFGRHALEEGEFRQDIVYVHLRFIVYGRGLLSMPFYRRVGVRLAVRGCQTATRRICRCHRR